MSPYYLLRLFSQNVKPAIMHPETTGAIILTKSSSTGLTSFRRIYRRKLRRLCYYIICESVSISTSDKLNYVYLFFILLNNRDFILTIYRGCSFSVTFHIYLDDFLF